MPNWTDNRLIVSGPKHDINKFVKNASGEGSKLDFNKFIQHPKIFKMLDDLGDKHTCGEILDMPKFRKELEKVVNTSVPKLTSTKKKTYEYVPEKIDKLIVEKLSENKNRKFGSSLGFNCGGYEWNTLHWGCKWNASDVRRHRVDGNTVEYTFMTPWSPPTPVVAAMGEMYKTLQFEMRSIGEGYEYITEVNVEKGKVAKNDSRSPTLNDLIDERGNMEEIIEEFYPEHIAQMLRDEKKSAASYTTNEDTLKRLHDAEVGLCVQDIKEICKKNKTLDFCDEAKKYCQGDMGKYEEITKEFLYGEKGV